ncbi:MAG: rRNA maturation RNase YbeY [Planctomycetota bacterium]
MSSIPDNSQRSADEPLVIDEDPLPSQRDADNLAEMQVDVVVDPETICPTSIREVAEACRAAARLRGFRRGEIAIRLTDDPGIHAINRRHLQHDFPTDVISFAYDSDLGHLHGDLVVSVDTAGRLAARVGWPMAAELLLYVVHGTLHLTGMDDHDEAERRAMRAAERQVFQQIGIADLERFGADRFDDQASVHSEAHDSEETGP